jgi:hypothetical protein
VRRIVMRLAAQVLHMSDVRLVALVLLYLKSMLSGASLLGKRTLDHGNLSVLHSLVTCQVLTFGTYPETVASCKYP